MRIIVFSDSHGSAYNIKKALAVHYRRADLAVHLGDGADDLLSLMPDYPELAMTAVAGNCDPEAIRTAYALEDKAVMNLGGVRVLMCHGHRLGVKLGYERLMYEAAQENCQIVLFGHTHVPYNKYIDTPEGGLYLFNPGSISQPRYDSTTCGIIDITDKGILLAHMTV